MSFAFGKNIELTLNDNKFVQEMNEDYLTTLPFLSNLRDLQNSQIENFS